MMLCFPLALQRVSPRVKIYPAPACGAVLGDSGGKSQLETFSIVSSTYAVRISKPEKRGHGKARWP
jgi:hypothetical protein